MKITHRPATEQDKVFAQNCHHRGYHDTVIKQFGAWDIDQQNGFFENTWRETFPDLKILIFDEKDAGIFCIQNKEDYIFLKEIIILPKFQGNGLGTFVLNKALSQAKARDVPARLQTLHKNPAAALYKKHGFTEYAHTDTHILMQSDKA